MLLLDYVLLFLANCFIFFRLLFFFGRLVLFCSTVFSCRPHVFGVLLAVLFFSALLVFSSEPFFFGSALPWRCFEPTGFVCLRYIFFADNVFVWIMFFRANCFMFLRHLFLFGGTFFCVQNRFVFISASCFLCVANRFFFLRPYPHVVIVHANVNQFL